MIHLSLFDLEIGLAADFMRWYREEHVPAMLEHPGWERARHYVCTDGHPRLSIYELADGISLDPPISEAPFRNGPFVARGLRNYHARTWRQIHAAGTHLDPPNWLNVVTVDIESRYADAFDRWYNDVHVPEILACPGWHANRRFECVDGEPRFLAIYDLEDDEKPFDSPEWERAAGWDEHVDYIRGFHGFRVYRLEFECRQ